MTYAQTQPDRKADKRHRTPKERAALRTDMKAKVEKMTPEKRKAFRQQQREKHQTRQNTMPLEQRERFMRRQEARRAHKPENS